MDEPQAISPSSIIQPDKAGQCPGWWSGAAVLAALVFLAYMRIVHAGFIWDDDRYIENNIQLRTLHGLEQIWLDPSCEPQYYPVTHTSFWIEYHLWGLNPLGYHIDNLLLHLGSALLLWGILRRLNVTRPWLIAAIFALHPLQVESVAWATERKNVLAGFFFFLSLTVYLTVFPAGGGEEKKSPCAGRLYVLSLGLFILSLLSKSVTASLPAVILLLYWWKHRRIRRADVLRLLPFFLLGLAMGSVTSWMEIHIVGATGPEYDFTLLQRCVIASCALWFYVYKLVFPAWITFTYPRWDVDVSARPWLLIFPVTVMAVVLLLWLLRRRLGRGPLVAVLLFAGVLFPALGFANIFPMRYSFVADHYQYLACIPIICVIVFVADRMLRQPAMMGAATIVIAILCIQTWRQVGIYHNRETLWRDTIEKNPTGFMAHSNLGDWLRDHGDPVNAEHEYLLSVQYNPDNFAGLRSLGGLNLALGNYKETIRWDQQALETARKTFAPDRMPYFIFGAIYSEMARAQANLGHTDVGAIDHQKAIDCYRKEIAVQPEDVDALSNLGQMLSDDGYLQEAIDLYHRALSVDPDSVAAHTNLGNALLAGGDVAGAAAEYKTSLLLQPGNAKAHNNLGTIYARQGLWDQAIPEFQAAIHANPGFQLARQNLARAIAAKAKSR